ISRQHKRISNKTVQHLVKSYLETAGLGGQGFSTHKLRHTAATLMYQHGNVDIRVLKDLLGHANLGTTQIYTHVSDQQIKRAVDANPLSTFQKK
ncbi:MAG: tyrosine-type recombinase/integrase, partial [Clostridia bacterium]|nr:tyrosine-type recombinase/integrase [Clostridia bacterium]